MAYNPAQHHRRSVRLEGYDYSQPGVYFLTLCTEGRHCIFGAVVDDEMRLNKIGRIVSEEWARSGEIRKELRLDDFVVMPNHVHGIVGIIGNLSLADEQRACGRTPLRAMPRRSISSFVGGFKAAVTARVNAERGTPGVPVWQRSYYDHIVRSDKALQAIREYIVTNPQRWADDRENPQGTGRDDIEAFVQALNAPAKVAAGAGAAGPGVRPHAPTIGAARDDGQGTRPRAPTGGAMDPVGARGRVPSPDQEATVGQSRRSDDRIATRIGQGYDLHRLRAGGRLILGGVVVSDEVSPIAHSDGDVVIHAVVDALLGAMAWGDIGEHFSNTDPRWKDAPSRTFLVDVFGRVRGAGYQVGNLDVTILAERPKLKPFKAQMAASLADLLDVPVDRVNVKAGTNEGCDAIGRGEAIAAHAVVLLLAADTGNP